MFSSHEGCEDEWRIKMARCRQKRFYKTNESTDGYWFMITRTSREDYCTLNLWVFVNKHFFLYTFEADQKYNRETNWSDGRCHKLLEDLNSGNSNVKCLRKIKDDEIVFANDNFKEKNIPQNPFKKQQGWEKHIEKVDEYYKRLKIEEKFKETEAPYILFGKHKGTEHEYTWKLFPDKPKRQGIVPGDEVLVWTRKGFKPVTVTRIEPAEGKEQPMCRVKKKIEKAFK